MNRKHITGISILIALAAIAGLIAVVRTTGIASTGSAAATDALVSARTKQLDQAETGLRSEIARLNAKVSAPAAAAETQAATVAPAADASERIVYVRPAPIVRSATGDDHGSNDDSEDYEQGEPDHDGSNDHGSDDAGSYEGGDDD
jgi:hypothetical protein